MALLVLKWDKEVKIYHVSRRQRMRKGVNNSANYCSQIKELREGGWGQWREVSLEPTICNLIFISVFTNQEEQPYPMSLSVS